MPVSLVPVIPLDPTAINKQLRSIISTMLDLPANSMRPANQNAPSGKQDNPYGTLLLTEIDAVGVDQRTYADQAIPHQLLETTSGSRKLMASVQFFRASANQHAARLGGLLRSSTATSLLNQAGICLAVVGKVTNLSQVIDTYWEERAQVEIEFAISSVEQLPVSTFAEIPLTVEIDNNSSTNEVILDQ